MSLSDKLPVCPGTDEMLGEIADLMIGERMDEWTAKQVTNIATSAAALAMTPGGPARIIGPLVCSLVNHYLSAGQAKMSMQSCSRIAMTTKSSQYAVPLGEVFERC